MLLNENFSVILNEIFAQEADVRLNLLASVAENANDVIILTEAYPISQAGPRIVYVNPAFYRMTGYQPEEVLGKTPRILQGPKTDRAQLDKIRDALSNWKSVRVELINYHKDGSEYRVELDIVPVADKHGRYTHWFSVQRDITERKRIEEERQKFVSLVENSNDFIAMSSLEGKVLFVNEAGRKLVGLNSLEEAVSKNLSDYLPEDEVVKFCESILPQILNGDRSESQGKLRHFQTGQAIDVQRSCFALRHPESGEIQCLATVQRDITERKRTQAAQLRAKTAEATNRRLEKEIAQRKRVEKQLRHNALHDSLTDLPNRLLFMNRLEHALARIVRHEDESIAVLFLDLDDFKMVNDSLGHYLGDQLLIEIARRLSKCLRPIDTIARLGGDEFTILLEELKEPSEAIDIAAQIHKEMQLPFHLGRQEIYTSTSIGIALSRSDRFDSPENLLRNADLAMYHAKKQGRGHHAVFDATMHARAVRRLELETALKRALEREEFFLHYQPIVSLDTGEIEGFEALVRWQHPERGVVPPFEFIPMAEATGLIVPLGEWVLQQACRQLRVWQTQSPTYSKLTMSVNLSSKQFTQPNLVEQIARILQSTELNPSCLRLEITESLLMENMESANAMLLELNQLGVKIYLDDFGTGFSSLSCLHSLPIGILKIDRSFVTNMDVDLEKLEIVRTIVLMAHNLGLEVIAEGIEKPEHLQQLKNLNCKYGQGYFFSRPVNEEAVTRLVGSKSATLPLN